MSHSHEGHSHSAPSLESINTAFYIGIGLNALFTLVEFIVGYRYDSLALISDASHNLSDVASLIISLIGMRLAKKKATELLTYGYRKASILASLINAVLLVFIVVKIFIEAYERILHPAPIIGDVIIYTALIGVIINSISAYLFYKGQKSDINVKGAFLHLVVDAIVSVGVVISGIIIKFTNWDIVDPIISIIIGIVILFSTWNLLVESLKLTLDGVPKNIDTQKIKNILTAHPQVKAIDHIHIWALSSNENALTVHLIVEEDISFKEYLKIKATLRHQLEHENIHHATFELDES